MQLIYSALLLHDAKQQISEANVTKVLQAAGGNSDPALVKALVVSLEGVNIEEAISKAAMPVAVASAPAAGAGEAKKEEKKEEDQQAKAEQAAEGLGALFG
ncbi:MAG: 50S ribosomal protein P1 [Candidatus Aenigmarchaeota archaeon]|nr:50S ribosomal protein P1 [Candidatus Aenigmarchaeota archaeon]